MKQFLIILSVLPIALIPFCHGEEDETALSSFQVIAPAEIVMGTSFELQIKALNQEGNLCPDFTGEDAGAVNLTTSGSGTLAPSTINSGGVGVFEDGIGKVQVTYDGATTLPETITITATLSSDPTITGTSGSITVTEEGGGRVTATVRLMDVSIDLTVDPVRPKGSFIVTYTNSTSAQVTGVRVKDITLIRQTDNSVVAVFRARATGNFDETLDSGETLDVRYNIQQIIGNAPTTWPCNENVYGKTTFEYNTDQTFTSDSNPVPLECIEEEVTIMEI